jgi:hypothetical protein
VILPDGPNVCAWTGAANTANKSAPVARTKVLSLSSAERSGIAEKEWDGMSATSRYKAIGDFFEHANGDE